ncbi:MAG: hypothetical protein U0W40_14935 [Acidimicrobiia bacterium]
MLLTLWSPKGGSGTSVFAAAVALAIARETVAREPGGRGVALEPAAAVRLADLTGDQPAVLGLGADPALGLSDWMAVGPEAPGEALDRMAVEVAAGCALLPFGAAATEARAEAGAALAVVLRDSPGPVVADCGTATPAAVRACAELADVTVAVLRPCYLALRRAVHSPLLAHTRGVVIVEESGRALGAREVTEVLDLPVLARVPQRIEIARAVDAGVVTTRLPTALARPALQLAGRAGLLPARRGAAA